jgi:phosphate transport system substrate-binding protein
VKTVRVSKGRGEAAITPTLETALDGTYPIARPLFLYTRGEPQGPVKAFIEWTLGEAGQQVVQDVGFVPAPRSAQ